MITTSPFQFWGDGETRALIELVPGLVFVASAEGANIFTNRRFQHYTGLSSDELLGNGWLAALHPGDRERTAEIWRTSVTTEEPYEAEYRLRSADGEYFWYIVRATPAEQPDGSLRWVGVCTDIDDQKRQELLSEQEADRSEARFRTVFQSMFSFIGLLDADGTLVEVNDAALTFGGLTAENVIGRRFWNTPWWDTSAEDRQRLEQAVSKAAAGEFVRYRALVKAAGDRLTRIDFTLKPILDAKGKVLQIIPEGRELVDPEASAAADSWDLGKAEFEHAAERFRVLSEHAPFMLYAYDLVEKSNVWGNRTMFEALGYAPDQIAAMTGGVIDTLIHPDDRAAHQLHLERLAALADNEVAELRYRFRRADGTWLWLHSYEMVLRRDDSGKPRQSLGVAIDVSGETAAIEDARASSRRAIDGVAEIEALYAAAPIGLCVLDRDLRYLRINERLAEINGIPAADHIGRTVGELLPDLDGQALAAMRRVLDGEPVMGLEITGTTPAQPGVQRTWRENWLPVRDSTGTITGITISAEEITQDKTLERAQAFRLRLTQALQERAEPEAMMDAACALLGEHLDVAQVGFAYTEDDQAHVVVRRDWCDGRIPSAVGRWEMNGFGPGFVRDVKAGKTIVIPDLREDERTNAPEILSAYDRIAARASLTRGLIRDGRKLGMLFIHHCEPRQWTPDEVALVEEVAERLWAALERAQARVRLRDREAQLRALFDHQFQFAAILAPDFTILDISRSVLKAGLHTDQIIGTSFLELPVWPQEVTESWQEQFEEAHNTTRSSVREERYYAKGDTEERWALNVVTAVRNDEGTLSYWVVEGLDVTDLKRAQAESAALGQSLRLAIDAVDGVVFEWDLASDTVTRLHSREVALPVTPTGPATFDQVASVVHPDDRAIFRQNVEAGLASPDGTYSSEYRIMRPDGAVRWLGESGHVEYGPDGQPARLTGISMDITARKVSELAVQQELDRQQLLLEVSQDLIGLRLDEAALAGAVYRRIASPFGADVCFNYRLDAGAQRLSLVFEHGVPEDRREVAASLELDQAFCGTVAASCQPIVAESARIAADPKGAFVHAMDVTAYACHPLKGGDGRILGTFSLASTSRASFSAEEVSFLQTVSNILAQAWERCAAEREVRTSDEFNRSLMDGSIDCIKVLNPEGRLLMMNGPGQCLMEIDDFGTIAGEEWSSLWPAAAREHIVRAVATALTGDAYSFEAFCPTAKGTPKWWEVSVTPVRDENEGKIVRLLSVSRDITLRKQAEEQFAQRGRQLDLTARTSQQLLFARELDPALLEQIFEDVAEQLGFAIYYHYRAADEPGLLRLASTKGVTAKDRERFATLRHGEQLCGRVAASRQRLIVEDLQQSAEPGSDALAATGAASYAGFPLVAGGELVGTIAFISCERRHLRQGEVQMIQTICEQIASSLERAASEARFRSLANGIPALMFVSDANGSNTFVNEPFAAYSGIVSDDLLGDGWLQVIHPDDMQRAGETWQASWSAGKPYAAEYRFRRADGSYRWHLARALPVRDHGQRIVEWIGTAIDNHEFIETRDELAASRITIEQANADLERKVAERTAELKRANTRLVKEIERRELTQAQLVQAQKLEALGQLTSGVAHDFNNVIAAIAGGFDLIARRSDDPRVTDIASHGASAASRGGQMVKQLLAFARQQVLEPRAVDLAALLDDAEPLLVRSVGQGIRVVIKKAQDLPLVRVDPVQLETALINLSVNARDAMPTGGTVTVSVAPCPSKLPERPTELGQADAVAIEIADDGPGIPAEVLQRVIEPFFTTKGPGKGTGLGLAMVHGFATQSGGALRIESRPGAGTRITIYLLVAQSDDITPTAEDPACHAGILQGDGARVLLVDDDDAVRSITAAQLADMGYAVREARGAAEAIALLATGVESDLVLSDVVMPEMDGITMGVRLRRDHPNLPIIFMTGHADRERLIGEMVIDKPFSVEALARSAATALARAAESRSKDETLDRLAARLRTDCVRSLLNTWRTAKGASPVPAFARFNPDDCDEPHKLVMAEVDPGKVPLAIRLTSVGRDLEQALGHELAGELALTGDDGPASLQAAYRRCALTGRPSYDYSSIDLKDGSPEYVERLVLPWSTDGTTIDRLVAIIVLSEGIASSGRSPV